MSEESRAARPVETVTITRESLRARCSVHILGYDDYEAPPAPNGGCLHTRAAFAFGFRTARSQGFRMFLQHAFRFWADSRPLKARGADAAEQMTAWLQAAAAAWAAAPLDAGTEDRAGVRCAAFDRLWRSDAANDLRFECRCHRDCVRAYRAGIEAAACCAGMTEHAAGRNS